ncbi:MAG: (2Fe-2S)-binding protein [Candidatus Hadarchaeales archaeon]
MSRHKISLRVNGELFTAEVEANRTLLRFLREDLGITGPKCACERGDCGLCTVWLDGVSVKSCMVLAVEADGREVTTVEGLAKDGQLTPVQRKFIEHGAVQCGFCTPAFILTAEAFLRENPNPTEEEVKEAIGGVLCRCTGYRQIIDAILDAAKDAEK